MNCLWYTFNWFAFQCSHRSRWKGTHLNRPPCRWRGRRRYALIHRGKPWPRTACISSSMDDDWGQRVSCPTIGPWKMCPERYIRNGTHSNLEDESLHSNDSDRKYSLSRPSLGQQLGCALMTLNKTKRGIKLLAADAFLIVAADGLQTNMAARTTPDPSRTDGGAANPDPPCGYCLSPRCR